MRVDPGLLATYGLTAADVADALRAANVSAPGGTILEGRYRYPLRTLGEFTSVQEVSEVVVARRTPGGDAGGEAGFRMIRLRDVATVVDGYAEREAVARLDGREAVGLLLFKEAGANTVAVAEGVEEVVAQLAVEYPSVRIDVASSQAGFISGAIANLVQEVITGGFLAFLMLFFFLRDPRYPVVVSAAIPASVLATFVLLDVTGVSLNVMSLGGLALGVGMLVDNSIVVLENIFRHRELGKDRVEAAAVGAEEVTGAITASTLTTIAVFAPIVYVEGVAGELFRDLSLAIAFSLLASLLVALTLLPAWAGRFEAAATVPGAAPEVPVPVRVGRRPGARGAVRWAVRWALSRGEWVVRWARALGAALLAFWVGGIGRALRRASTPVLDSSTSARWPTISTGRRGWGTPCWTRCSRAPRCHRATPSSRRRDSASARRTAGRSTWCSRCQ